MRERILAAITQRPRQFCEIHAFVGLDHHFRHVDRELQKMRRAGVVAYDRVNRVWRIAAQGNGGGEA